MTGDDGATCVADAILAVLRTTVERDRLLLLSMILNPRPPPPVEPEAARRIVGEVVEEIRAARAQQSARV